MRSSPSTFSRGGLGLVCDAAVRRFHASVQAGSLFCVSSSLDDVSPLSSDAGVLIGFVDGSAVAARRQPLRPAEYDQHAVFTCFCLRLHTFRSLTYPPLCRRRRVGVSHARYEQQRSASVESKRLEPVCQPAPQSRQYTQRRHHAHAPLTQQVPHTHVHKHVLNT